MKRHRSLVAIIATLAIIFSMQSISFAWTIGSSNISNCVADGNKVETSINSAGQSVYRVYQWIGGQKNLIHEVFARSSNIWNNTTSVLLANGTNKSASYCGIDRNLNVYGIDTSNIATRFKNGFTKWDTPDRLTEYPGAYGFEYDEDGFVTGIKTGNGVYDIQSDKIVNYQNNFDWNLNSDNNSEYPFILQDNNEYHCHVNPSRIYTYVLSYNRLSLNGQVIASNVNADIQCGINNFLVYTTESQAHIVRMGSYNSTVLCDNFAQFIYQDQRVIGAKDIYGQSYWISNYSNNNNDNFNYDCNDDYVASDRYPYALQDGDYYYFYRNSNIKYQYELNSNDSLYYWNSNGNRTYITGNVDYIAFSDEYMLYVVGNTANAARIGTTYTEKTYSGFIDFVYDENGMVIAVNTKNGTTWL